jgi:small subunit ribosomal protein S5
MAKQRQSRNKPKDDREFDQRIIDLARVTRVMAGGKRMRFRACVAIGDKKGKCGMGLAKGADVTVAINKAVNKAKKTMIQVPIVNETIPHKVFVKEGSARVMIKPAPQGTGVKAGGAVRMVFELAGVPNVSAKIIGGGNKINNVRALFKAFQSFKPVKFIAKKPIKVEPKAIEKKAEVGDVKKAANKTVANAVVSKSKTDSKK